MAIYYVRSGATGSNNGSSWANAYTILGTAMAGKANGDTFYVADDHAESVGSSQTYALGTVAIPCKIVCVDHNGSVPPVSADLRTTASITTTGTFNITLNGTYSVYGIMFATSGSGSITLGSGNTYLINCSLRPTGGLIIIGTNVQTYTEWINTTISLAGAGQVLRVGGHLKWRNTASALVAGTLATNIFQWQTNTAGRLDCIGVDLSGAGSGQNIVGNGLGAACSANFLDCKVAAAATKSATPAAPGASEVDFIRSTDSGVNYTIGRYRYTGTLTEETTIVRTGGATDGTTTISWKILTTANVNFAFPFECPPIAIWNDITGTALIATVEGIWGGGAVPNDDEVWVDVEYLGSSSSSQGSFVNDGKADLLATAAGQSSSSATWGGSTTKFKLNVSFTPQQKGWIYARVKCAKSSSTFYIDPLVTLT